ncbi:MAG TPA: MarR family transcriptional regulator [Ilumatobacter sp.]|nr:MarR family transcriptional regulator [Ilumatobacter sp.]
MADTSDPRWLDADELTTWLAVIGLTIRLPAALDRQLRRDAGISHFEYQVLAGLSEAPHRTLRISTLAEFAEGSLPRVSQVVSRLEQRGWLYRSPDPADGRYTLATLTDTGWDKVVATAPGHVAHARRLVIDQLSRTEQARLRSLATRITDAIDASEHPET